MESKDLSRMTRPQLVEYAETLGFAVKPDLPIEELRDGLRQQIDAQNREADRVTADSVKEMVSVDDPLLKVKFVNSETPGADVEFTFEGKPFHLRDGEIYMLPRSVIRHLNNDCVVPVYENFIEPTSGIPSARPTGQTKNRFSLQVVV